MGMHTLDELMRTQAFCQYYTIPPNQSKNDY